MDPCNTCVSWATTASAADWCQLRSVKRAPINLERNWRKTELEKEVEQTQKTLEAVIEGHERGPRVLTPLAYQYTSYWSSYNSYMLLKGSHLTETVHVLMQVKNSGNCVMFLLSNEETDRYYTSQKMTLNKERANLELLPLKPRLIELQKGENGYGFYLRLEQNTGGKNQVNTQAMSFAIQLIPVQGLQTSFSLSGSLVLTSKKSSTDLLQTRLHLENCFNPQWIVFTIQNNVTLTKRTPSHSSFFLFWS